MATNKLVFEVVVSDGGTAKITQKGIENVGRAAENVTRKTREAGKAQDELNYKLNQGTTGVSSAAKSFSKLNQAIGSGPNGLVGAYATLAANAFAVSAAFSALREAAQVEQMMRGLEVQGARTGKSLTGLSKELQQLTNYSISAADAMQATALMSSAGFSSQGMKELTAVANNAALALGRNVPDALDRISKGVTKLEPELLDELGIMTKLTEAQAMYAFENNKSAASLTSFEKRQAMLNAVVAEGTAKFGGLSDQVSANPYDQLAATFSDLTKNVLGFANGVLGPIARIFGSSQGMLLGGVILFVSSIKKQLMPALFEMSKNAAKAKESHLEEAAAIREKTAATLADAKAKRASAVIDARTKTGGIAGAALPKKFKVDEIRQGALSVKELNEELNRLNSSIRARETGLEGRGAAAVSPTKVAQKKAELELIKQERDNLKNLIDLETKGQTDLTPLREAARKGRLEYIAATKLAAVEGKKSQALEAAAAGNLKEGWQKAKEAALEYKRAVAAQGKLERVQADGSIAKQGLMARIGERAQGIAGTAGIFAQTAAAGFMKFLPYIGVATTALSGAWAVYKNFFQSDAEKARIEALKKLKETLDNTAKSVKELTRLNEASIPIGLKAAQTLTIQSNATAQIADSFKQVQEAAEKAAKGQEVDSFWKALIGSPEDAVSYATGIAKDSSYFKPIAEEFTNSTASYIGTGLGAAIGGILGSSLGPVGTVAGAVLGAQIGNQVGVILAESLPEEFNGIDEEAVAALRSIDQLSKIMRKDLVDSMVAAAGGANNLANSPALRANFIAAAERAYRGVAEAVKTLQEAFKQTGVAIADFFKSSLKATPFDTLVQGYQAVNKAFRELDGTLGGSNLTDQIKLLSSMPEEMMRMLDLPQQQLLKTLSEQASKIAENDRLISQIQQKGEDMTDTDRSRLAILRSENDSLNQSVSLYGDQADDIKRSLISSEAQYRTLQAQSRQYDNQLKLIGAIANANSEIYSKSAEGEKARISRHNEAIRLQQAQIRIQINMAETYIAQTENLINQLEVQQTILEVTKEQDSVSLQAAQRRAEEQRESARAAALSAGLSEKYLQSIERIINNAKNKGTQALVDAAVGSYGDVTKEQIQAATTYFNAAKTFEVAATRSANEISINDYTTQVSDFRQNIASMRTEIAALGETQIGAQEEAARIESVRSAILAEQENIRRQIEEITEQTTDSVRTSLTLERNIKNAIYENIRAKSVEGRRRADDAAAEAAQNLRRLRNEQAVLRGRLADHKNIAEAERTSINAAIDNLTITIGLQEQLLAAKLGQIQADTQLAILEAVIGEGQQKYLERLQESVRMREQELDLVNSVKDQQVQIAQNAARIRLAGSGTTPDERTQKAFEVESAERAYQNALSLQEIKMRGIEAEYDLLEARRDIDVAALRTNAYMLRVYDQIFNNGRNSAEIEQLLGTVTEATVRMGRVDFSAMRQNARASQENELTIAKQRRDLARAEYEGLYTATTRTQAVIANAAEEFRAIQRANQISTEAISSEDKVFTLDLSDQATANRAVVDRLLDIRTSLERIRETAVPELEEIAAAITGRTSNALSDRQAATAAMVAAAESAGLRVGEYSAREKIAPGSHEDPGHYNATAFDLSGGTRTQIEQQVQAAVLRGATVIWQRQRLTLGSEGQINRQAYNPGPNAKGTDVYHERHAHISFKNAIESAAEAAAPTVTSATSNAVSTGAQEALAPLLDAAALRARAEEVARILENSSTITVDTRSFEEQFDAFFAERIAQSENEIVVTGKRAVANKELADSERLAAKAANDNDAAQRNKTSGFELFVRSIPRAMEIATTQMEELGTAMSERLGVDFGPDGQVVKSLMSVMTTLSVSMPNTIKVLSQTFADWQTQNAEAMKGITVDTQKSIYQAQQLASAFSAASQVIGSVATLIKSISDAKVASVDKEIAAEERRDGKSAASVAKIDALEKKKDAMARKSFNTQKKLMMAQAVMSTAAAVASTYAALAPFGPWVAIPAAAVVGAAGLAQLAIIAGTQYESSYSPKTASTPSSLSIGKRDSGVNLAMGPNANAGGEVGYLRGAAGTGTSASNYNSIGSAYGGDLSRGYGNRGFIVGEKGPELITPETPINVTPANENAASNPVNATINIQAIDSQGVQDVLVAQKGNIIQMLRQAANANGQRFLEDVNVNVYTRPSVGKLL